MKCAVSSYAILALVVLIHLVPINKTFCEVIPEGATIAAREGLSAWQSNCIGLPERAKKIYGVKNTNDVYSAHLGEPYANNMISAKDLYDYNEDMDFLALCKFYSYRFPIIINETISGFITVRYVYYIEGQEEGCWFATGIGPGATKEHMIYKLQKEYPQSEGYNVIATSIHWPINLFFLIIKQDSINILPASNEAARLGSFESDREGEYTLTSLETVIHDLKRYAKVVVKNIENLKNTRKPLIEE